MALLAFSWRSLKTRITLTSLVIFVSSIWALSFFSSNLLHKRIEKELGNQQFSTASMVADHINDELSDRLQILSEMARLSTHTLHDHPREIQAFIDQHSGMLRLFNAGLYITDKEGIITADLPIASGRIGVETLDREYMSRTLNEGKQSISRPVIGKVANAPILVMTTPIRDAHNHVIGALAGVINLGRPNFLDQISKSRYGLTGGYLLIDPEGRLVITATDKNRIMETLPAKGVNPMIDRFIEGYEGSSVVVRPDGVEVLASAKGIPVAGWYVTASLPTSEAFALAHDTQNILLFATIFLTLLAGTLMWLLLSRELSQLQIAAKNLARMADEDIPPQPLSISRRDEIGHLVGGFNRLLEILGHRETALRESEARFRAFHDASLSGIAIHEHETILDCNQSLSDMTGFASEELIGMEGFLLVAPEYRATVKLHISVGFDHAYDAEGLRKDGTRFPVSIRGKFIPYKGRTVRVTEFQDITVRKQAIDALRASEENLAITLYSIGDAVITTDATGRVTRMNPMAERLTGWKLAEGSSHLLPEIFHIINSDTREVVTNPVQRVMEYGQVVGLASNTVLVARDGQEYQIADSAAPIRNAAGGIVGVVLVFSDVTEKYRIQDALHETQAILQAALDQSPAGIAIADAPDGALRYVNDSGLIIRGQDRKNVVYGVGMENFFSNRPLFDLDGRPLRTDEVPLARAILFGESCSKEFRIRRPDDSERIVVSKAAPIRNKADEIVAGIAVFLDITESKVAEDEIKRLAFYDQLTGLPNRRLLIDRLKQALATRSRHHCGGALLFIDLDNFKTLNDTLGHAIGDLLLQQVSQRLVACVREGDTVARFGGDEFVVMLEGLSENDEVAANQTETAGEKIIAMLSQTYQLASYMHHSTASIGIALFDNQTNVEELLKRADLAMYEAKAAGRNTLRFFDPEMQTLVTAHAALEADLREAILNEQFVLYYQAQVDSTGHTLGAEVLLRWEHPERGLVSPMEFIPLTEETGLILPLGQWVLGTACNQLAIWSTWPEMAHLTIAVNVSARQFHHKDFVDQVQAALDHSGACPYLLKLELTEGLLLDDVEDVIAKMTILKAKGVGFALDDFGTGYSSLSYLKRLPLDQLKIDQSFVRDILNDPNDAAIARTIVALGQSLGLAVIAEGVETEAQKDCLAKNGCLAYQGYYFSRPMPLEGFEQFVQRG